MKKQYFVKQLDGIVEIDREFLKAAGQIDTDECALFERLRNKYPAYKFIVTDLNKSNKITYPNLTYDRMEQFIKTCLPKTESVSALAEFKKIKTEADSKDAPYSYVKSWFLSKYKKQYNKTSFAQEDKKKETEKTTADTAPAAEIEKKEVA